MLGHLKTNTTPTKVSAHIHIYFNNLFTSAVHCFFINILMIPIMITTAPTSMIYFPATGFSISGALAILSTPNIPTVIIPAPIAMILLIQSPMSSNQNNAISMNAVCFAINAQANIAHEMMIYLRESRWILRPCSRLSITYLRKMNPDSIANIVNAITQRSVLLSTKTRKAPIPLVSRNNSIIHPLYVPSVVTVSSSSFSD